MKNLKNILWVFIIYASLIGIVIMCSYSIGYNNGMERAIPVLEDCVDIAIKCVNLL